MQVDLPAPLRPSSASRSPGMSVNLRPLSSRPIAIAGALPVDRQQRLRQPGRHGEAELEGRGVHVRRGDALHARQRLEAALRLARLGGLGAEALDEGLHVADLALLARVQRRLLGQLGGALLLEGRIVATVGARPPVLDVDDAVADAVEELAIVRDQQQRAGIGAQPALEPEDGVDVEMVGGLVEQQQVGAAHERARHVDAHPPAAGKCAQRPLIVGRAQSRARA